MDHLDSSIVAGGGSERRWNLAVMGALLVASVAQWSAGIRWGDGLEFVSVSAHLGVAHPPGYPLFTLLGWLALSVLPNAEPYAAVLWVCKAAVIGCGFGLYLWGKSILARHAVSLGARCSFAGLFALAFTFGGSLWPTAGVVEVYGLDAALLVWIGSFLSHPGHGRSRRDLLLASTLFGLALANHTSSLCMAPMLVLAGWRILREPEGMRTVTAALALAVLIPTALYASLLLRVPAASGYGIGWGGFDGPAGLLAHMRGGEYGTTLFLHADPSTPFTLSSWLPFCVERLVLLTRSLGAIFFGSGAASFLLGVCFLVFAGVGIAAGLRRRDQRSTAVGLVLAVLLQLAFVVTFNIRDIEDYFLGIHVLLLPFLIAGMASLGGLLRRRVRVGFPLLPWVAAGLLVIAVPVHRKTAYPESRHLAARWVERLLAHLPRGASLITVQDEDIYMLWYLQMARGERRDLAVYGANFVRSPWFRTTMLPTDPRREAVGFSKRPLGSLTQHVEDLRRLAIDPLLRAGRVFTTIHDDHELGALVPHYEFRPIAQLLLPREIELLQAEGRLHGPRFLWEIRPK